MSPLTFAGIFVCPPPCSAPQPVYMGGTAWECLSCGKNYAIRIHVLPFEQWDDPLASSRRRKKR